jgi:hypothetical protein
MGGTLRLCGRLSRFKSESAGIFAAAATNFRQNGNPVAAILVKSSSAVPSAVSEEIP